MLTSNNLQSQPKFSSIQILRGVAAMLIVIAHIYPNYLPFGGDKSALPNFIFGACGVDLFFVISGFVMLYTSEHLFAQPGASRIFLSKRILRIVPLYWLFTAAVILPAFFLHRHVLDWQSIVASFSFMPHVRADGVTAPILGVGWTLEHEMFFYFCFAIMLVFPRKFAVLGLTILFVSIINFGPKLAPYLPAKFALGVWTNTLNYEFIYGIWIAYLYRLGVRIPVFVSYVLVAIASYLLIYTYMHDFVPISRHVGWGFGAAMIIVAVTLAKVKPLSYKRWKPLIILGDASYAIYLFHALLPHYLHVVMLKFFNPAVYPYSYAVFLISLTLIGSLITHFVFEKPLTAWLYKFIKSKPTNPSTTVDAQYLTEKA